MTAGNLDRRVQFQRETTTNSGLGEVSTWANYGGPVWASRKDVSDGEKAANGGVFAEVTARFQLRGSSFSQGLRPKDRLVTGGRSFEIIGIKELGTRGAMLEITATASLD